MSAEANHVVIITLDQEMIQAVQENGDVIDPTDREFWEVRIRCEANKEDFTRPCMMRMECKCTLSEDERDELCRDGEGSCPESPSGVHVDSIGDLSPARSTRGCWAVECDGSAEAVEWLMDKHKLGLGEYRVHVIPDYDSIEFELANEPAA